MSTAPNRLRTRPLSSTQERKAVEYVDYRLLDLTRNFKKRSHTSTSLPTLQTYLEAVRLLLAVILQIPPTRPTQASLRISLLLRLTGEALASIPGYAPAPEPLPDLLAILDVLDRGWLAVLRAQVWDPEAHEGVDMDVANGATDIPSPGTSPEAAGFVMERRSNMDLDRSPELAPQTLLRETGGAGFMSQTERTRLRSLLMSGTSQLESWLENLRVRPSRDSDANGIGDMQANDAESPLSPENDLSDALERLGLQQSFDDLFERTLSEMGDLHGDEPCTGEEVEMS